MSKSRTKSFNNPTRNAQTNMRSLDTYIYSESMNRSGLEKHSDDRHHGQAAVSELSIEFLLLEP